MLFFSFSYAKDFITIDSNNTSLKNFKVEYFIDTSKKLKFDDIKIQKFKKGLNKDSLGVDVVSAWVKIKV
ncbi:hypothetical protein, partial [Poseidonibacter sp.]|uniref:hypothetical protein n=1 Tax=Poseidonibacter sp. TaxID=2321188 RepID=UPI003C78EB19